jgi:hypothetical protein
MKPFTITIGNFRLLLARSEEGERARSPWIKSQKHLEA